MDKINYKQYIEDSYNWARHNGFCKTKLEFAKILGVHPATLSMKDNRYSGRNTAMKIEVWRKSVEQTITSEKEEKEFDWEAYRMEVSKVILTSIVTKPELYARDKDRCAAAAKDAIVMADELIKQLKECSQ